MNHSGYQPVNLSYQSGGEPAKLQIWWSDDDAATVYELYLAGSGGWQGPVVLTTDDIREHGFAIVTKTRQGESYQGSVSDGSPVDVVYVFYAKGSSLYEIALAFTGPATVTVIAADPLLVTSDQSADTGYTDYDYVAAIWDETDNRWHVAMAYSGSSPVPGVLLLGVTDTIDVGGPSLTNAVAVSTVDRLITAGSWNGLHLCQSPIAGGSGSKLLAYTLDDAGLVTGAPVSYDGTDYSFSRSHREILPNLPATVSDFTARLSLSFSSASGHPAASDGKLKFVLTTQDSLWAMTRTAPSSYTSPRRIARATSSGTPILAYDTNTGDLYLAYDDASDDPAGEIKLVKQPSGGPWKTPYVVAGGGAGFQNPTIASIFDSSGGADTGQSAALDIVFVEGTGPYTLNWVQESAVMAPLPPANVSPSGPVQPADLTAVDVSWGYRNNDPTNGQGQYRVEVKLNSDLSSVYDSGWTSGSDETAVIGATLDPATTYQLTVSTRDGGGAGTGSTTTTFTPYGACTVTIDSVAEAPPSGADIPDGNITASQLVDVTFTPASDDALTAVFYRQDILDGDGHVLYSSGRVACSIASGSPFTGEDFDIFGGGILVNDGSTTYVLRIACWFQGTGGLILVYS